MGRGHHRPAGPAGRDAGHRPQGTPPSSGAAAVHRRRRPPVHLIATDTRHGQLADLELRHRRRARCQDRIRNAKDTGLRNLPLKGLRPEPDLVGDRGPALRADRVDADARPHRAGPPLGAQAAALPHLRRRGPPRQQRAPAAAPARRALVPGRGAHRRSHLPAAPHVWLTSRNSPTARKEKPLGPVEPRPPGATAGQPGTVTR
jgi:hypothetical protein